MYTLFPLFLFLLSLVSPTLSEPLSLSNKNSTEKPRIFILSDTLNEPDDSQSIVRYLLYSNEFQTEGLVAVTSTWLPNETHPEAIRDIIGAYGDVVDNLNAHVPKNRSYPSKEKLMGVVSSGPKVYGKKALQNNTISPGAKHLITALKSSTPSSPLHVPVWGGTNALAQAIQHITQTSTPEQAVQLRSHLRVYAISDQDDTGAWIRQKYPDIFFIVSRHAWRAYSFAAWLGISTLGVSPLANDTVVSNAWLKRNIQQQGKLGKKYPDTENIMEGDSPSLLYFIPNGLGHFERPEWGSWGGRYASVSEDKGDKQFADTYDNIYSRNVTSTEKTNQATIWRWRCAFQNDFAARMQWSLSSDYKTARHPPVIRINGHEGLQPLIIKAHLNQTLQFDASETMDTDANHAQDGLQFEWFQYQEASYLPAPPAPENERLTIHPVGQDSEVKRVNEQGFKDAVRAKRVRVTLPSTKSVPVEFGYHLILQVITGGKFPITRYKRVVLVL